MLPVTKRCLLLRQETLLPVWVYMWRGRLVAFLDTFLLTGHNFFEFRYEFHWYIDCLVVSVYVRSENIPMIKQVNHFKILFFLAFPIYLVLLYGIRRQPQLKSENSLLLGLNLLLVHCEI